MIVAKKKKQHVLPKIKNYAMSATSYYKYYCKGCDQIIFRATPTVYSFCSSNNEKQVNLIEVNDKTADIFIQLKKLSK